MLLRFPHVLLWLVISLIFFLNHWLIFHCLNLSPCLRIHMLKGSIGCFQVLVTLLLCQRSFQLTIFIYAVLCLVAQSYQLFLTPWNVAHQTTLSMGLLRAGILEWVAMPSSRGSSQPRDRTHVFCITGSLFTV